MSVQISYPVVANLVKALGVHLAIQADLDKDASVVKTLVKDLTNHRDGTCANCGEKHDNENHVRAAYDVKHDNILFPPGSSVTNATDISVLFHEIAHWSGAFPRLNRVGVAGTNGDRRVSGRDIAVEEVIAELAAEKLAQQLGFDTLAETTAYIFGYLLMFMAAREGDQILSIIKECDAEAQRAVEYITKTATANGFSQKIDRQAA